MSWYIFVMLGAAVVFGIIIASIIISLVLKTEREARESEED
jgi:hypothetical protein